MQLADGSFDETFRGPEWHDQFGENGLEGIKEQIKVNDPLALEEVQMLNDLAAGGDLEAQLTLFNMYL